MLKARDDNGRTILACAASNGGRDIFDTVLETVMDELDPAEVHHIRCLSVYLYYTFNRVTPYFNLKDPVDWGLLRQTNPHM